MTEGSLKESPATNELKNLIDGYQLCARAEGRSENTITLNTIAVRQLNDFLIANGLSTDISQIGPAEIRNFIVYLQKRKVSSNHTYVQSKDRQLKDQSINDYMRAISAVWLWFETEELIDVNLFNKVKIPKATKAVIIP